MSAQPDTDHDARIEADLALIAEQEALLQFDRFDADAAFELGSRLRDAATAYGTPVAIEIWQNGSPLFFFAMPGTAPSNADWLRRKRNTVWHFGRSSYAIGLKLAHSGDSLAGKHALAERDYAAHGGAFPLAIRGTGIVGSIAISGLPQRDDHGVVVAVIAEYLGIDPAAVALPG
ncbi:heme-degrading domain-containing protein [Jeongeupia sp. USM3]|uniref:heme-degrading domain-containing protein n=1 Tax=Jeongeupia sp. USM3 TaxID=1906741 RepID=UPI00089DF240|nr:heme-degrading domain-containing protein [Jeongeupia sp. USM3]AOY01343.1 hypothetical protein BJP62_13320 [Jeongeupia sp. USM3]